MTGLSKEDTEFYAFLSAAKGEPFTEQEWETRVVRLEQELLDARKRHAIAVEHGQCVAERFDDAIQKS